MFKLTLEEIKEMETSIDNFEKDTLKYEALTESGCFVRDLFINGHDCRICFIISMVEEDEDDGEDTEEE